MQWQEARRGDINTAIPSLLIVLTLEMTTTRSSCLSFILHDLNPFQRELCP